MNTKVIPVASFKPNTFLENIAVRFDGSILVTAITPKVLYYLPCPVSRKAIPQVVHTFDEGVMGIVELEHDMFYISTSDFLQKNGNMLWKLDMSSFDRLGPPEPSHVLTFPSRSRLLNGSAALSANVILCADSWADLIWRVDIPPGGGKPLARVWMEHEMFAHSQDPDKYDVPGVNGLKYDSKTHFVYFTTTAQTILGRVRVDPDTLDPASGPEEATGRWMWADDLIIDEEAGFGYVTTHRQNTIERICLRTGARTNMAGNPINFDLIGPTAGAWGRQPGELGKVAYFSTDGGIKNPVDGIVRESKVLRVEFQPNLGTSYL